MWAKTKLAMYVFSKEINKSPNSHPEYGNWMIEKIPNIPFSDDIKNILLLESHLLNEYKDLNKKLEKNVFAIPLSNFPKLGIGDYYTPKNN